MVKSASSPSLTQEQLSDVLGYQLSKHEIESCLKNTENLTPKVGQFWQTADAQTGIYIITQGKVRLLDTQGELMTTLVAGASFGESTLFPGNSFFSYSARASVNLKLSYLPGETLLPLIKKHPQIREHLYQVALKLNSLQKKVEPEIPNSLGTNLPEFNITQDQQPEVIGQKNINKAYFPSPTQRVGHLWQRITRRYPFFAQQSGSDCGAACLVMVARYWGKNFSVNRVRDIANVDRNGASLRGLSAAAESIGYSTRPVKASLDQLAKQKLPQQKVRGYSTRPVKASLDQLAKQKLPAMTHWEDKHYILYGHFQ